MFDKSQCENCDIGSVLLNEKKPEEAVKETRFENLYIIPAGRSHKNTITRLYDLVNQGLDPKKMDDEEIRKEKERRFDEIRLRMRNILNPLFSQYDYVFIDNNPNGLIITEMALIASDFAFSPVEADGFSYKGMGDMISQVKYINLKYNSNLMYLGPLLCKAMINTKLFRQMYNQYLLTFRNTCIKTFIRNDNTAKEALTMGMPLIEYGKSRAGNDYMEFAKEIKIITGKEYEHMMKHYGMREKFDLESFSQKIIKEFEDNQS